MRRLFSHRALFGYVFLVLAVLVAMELRQGSTHADIEDSNHQSCLALIGVVEAQRLALFATIRATSQSNLPEWESELPYFHQALDSLDIPRCAR